MPRPKRTKKFKIKKRSEDYKDTNVPSERLNSSSPTSTSTPALVSSDAQTETSEKSVSEKVQEAIDAVFTIMDDSAFDRMYDKAILSTLAYRSVFKSALSYHQLATFLLSESKVDHNVLKERLQKLIKDKKVHEKKGRYYLPDNSPYNWFARSKNSTEHEEKVQHVLETLSKVKWIKMLSITGSVAARHARKEDDIDIFIVTEKDRLWVTRLFVVLLLKAFGVYRSDDDSSGKICPNIFVDETAMSWPEEKRNIYVAHEILMMHPVVNKNNTYFKFIKKNDWVFDYFSNYHIHLPKRVNVDGAYDSLLINWFERLLMNIQMRYMKKHQTTEVTTNNLIHFNKTDHSGRILNTFHSILSRG